MKMRAKMKLSSITNASDTCETLNFVAVCKSDGYPADGSDEDNTFARWTPTASLSMTITNPSLIGKFTVDDKYYLDFTKVE